MSKNMINFYSTYKYYSRFSWKYK